MRSLIPFQIFDTIIANFLYSIHKINKDKYIIFSGDTSVISLEDDIDPERVGAVIGTKGQCISEIMKRSGCRIVINQAFPKGEQHRITFSGTT
jgi:hypothetical protein